MVAQSEDNVAEMIFPGVSAKDGDMKLYVVTCSPPEAKFSEKEKENPWSARKSAIILAQDAAAASSRAETFFNRKKDRDYRAIEINLWGGSTEDKAVFTQER